MNKELNRVLDEIERVTRFDARLYRSSTLERRINFRMRATNSKSYSDYISYLKTDQSEYDEFLNTLTINVTDFFRDKWVFRALRRKIIPEMLKKIKENRRKSIRIWSIGCSKGQEPYSLAILLSELLDKRMNEFKIIIHATDVNSAVVRHAKSGFYRRTEIKNVPRIYLAKYFMREDGGYRVNDRIKNLVKFKQHDLIKEESLGKFDLILCRNLFIFFQPQLQERMLEKIHASLKRGGVLVLGSAETPRDQEHFQPMSSRDQIYRKRMRKNDMKNKTEGRMER